MDKNTRFLVVDDDSLHHMLNIFTLKALGFSYIYEAEDGDIALLLMRDITFHVVITDGNMPRLSGFKLIEAMKKDEYLRHIPVIMVTGELRPEDRKRGLELGASDYLQKPVKEHELRQAIEKVLS